MGRGTREGNGGTNKEKPHLSAMQNQDLNVVYMRHEAEQREGEETKEAGGEQKPSTIPSYEMPP